ncbi:MAG: SDR family NAD(P)-dependent oxidoreductase [Wenzhouxiangella sp.]
MSRPATAPARPLALITGASAGIGAEYARQMAAAGHDLVLTARRRDRLEELAASLKEAHGCSVQVIAADLTDPGAPAAIVDAIHAEGGSVEVLVNNAGYAIAGVYHQTEWRDQADFLQVMVTAVAELTHRLLPAMREQGRGGVINIASLAGAVPGSSGHTLYAAVKSWMISFSESLAMENAKAGVCVQALCPGFTYSEFHDVVGTRDIVSKMPDYMWMTAEEVVRISLDRFGDLEAPVMLIPGRWNRFVAMLARKLPYRMAFGLVKKRSGEFRRQE